MAMDKSSVSALALEPSERLSLNLQNGRLEHLARIFKRAGAAPPYIYWSPEVAELRNPMLKSFAAKCRELEGDRGQLLISDLDLDAFGKIARNLMVVVPTDCPRTFRYEYYGTAICEAYGKDMTGQTTNDLAGHISLMYSAIYQAARARCEWVMSEHEPPRQVFVQSWLRLVVPVYDVAGNVAKFLVFNHADNDLRAGLEIMPDPVLVVGSDGRICYANPAASDLWCKAGVGTVSGDFTEVTGLPLPLGTSPREMLDRDQCTDAVELTLQNTLIARFMMTVSAALYREQAFYIVSLRLLRD